MHDKAGNGNGEAERPALVGRLEVSLFADGRFIVDAPFQDRMLCGALLREAEFQLLKVQLADPANRTSMGGILIPGRTLVG